VTKERVDVAIIGAGQAGLATSWYLTRAGVDHVVLEAGRVAETWRTRRWDSFSLVTPNWSVMLPGRDYDGPDPEGFMPRNDLVAYLERWAASFDPPVRGGCEVSALEQEDQGGGFALQTLEGKLHARTVVVASGGYQRAHLPPGTRNFPSHVTQLRAEDYRNPQALPDGGGVLIVGSGQTGCQLAEELHHAGRKVVLACGHCIWAPRRFGGHDLVWWLLETGFAHRSMADLPSPKARLLGNPQATGRDGGHDLHYRTLHEMGVELVDRFVGAEDGRVHFGDDLSGTIAAGDGLAAVLKKWIDALCAKRGLADPWTLPAPLVVDGRSEIHLEHEDIGTVIWTTGYRPAFDWIHIPVFDDMGFPVQTEGRTEVDGLYFMGVHFQRKSQSATLYGVREDAELVAQHIIENRG
jgi:putative flavoprotein involved in K+ transport